MEQVTRGNPPTRPSNRNGPFPYKAGTYFTMGHNLYYIVELDKPALTVLVEDCYSNKRKWISKGSLGRTQKEVILPK